MQFHTVVVGSRFTAEFHQVLQIRILKLIQ